MGSVCVCLRTFPPALLSLEVVIDSDLQEKATADGASLTSGGHLRYRDHNNYLRLFFNLQNIDWCLFMAATLIN